MPNRSITIYLLEVEQPGMLSRIGSHVKRNIGKYALGAAAIGAGGLLANPALATNISSGVGTAIQNAGNAVGLGGAANTLSSGVNAAGQAVQGVAQSARTGIGNIYNSAKTAFTPKPGVAAAAPTTPPVVPPPAATTPPPPVVKPVVKPVLPPGKPAPFEPKMPF